MTGEKLFLKNRGNFLILVLIFAVSGLCTTCKNDTEEAPVTDLWEKLRNTAWKMEVGDKKCIIGFYGPGKGPFPGNGSTLPYFSIRYYGYLYSLGNSELWYSNSLLIGINGKKISETEKFYWGDQLVTFNVFVSSAGEKLTISNSQGGTWGIAYNINGTYTKVSSDPNFNWDEYWNQ